MTREEFESVRAAYAVSGRPLKAYLKERGIAYTTFHYWRRKLESEQKDYPIAPISLRDRVCEIDTGVRSEGAITAEGVMIAFPNGLRAHFGRGSEGMLMRVLTQSMPSHVLS